MYFSGLCRRSLEAPCESRKLPHSPQVAVVHSRHMASPFVAQLHLSASSRSQRYTEETLPSQCKAEEIQTVTKTCRVQRSRYKYTNIIALRCIALHCMHNTYMCIYIYIYTYNTYAIHTYAVCVYIYNMIMIWL